VSVESVVRRGDDNIRANTADTRCEPVHNLLRTGGRQFAVDAIQNVELRRTENASRFAQFLLTHATERGRDGFGVGAPHQPFSRVAATTCVS
jgi:hypothetical protein